MKNPFTAIRKIYTKIIHALSEEQKIVITIFSILFLTIFLGDGKQQTIDVFISGCVVFLGIYWFIVAKHKQKSLPKNITRMWLGIIIYTILRSIFSDSVAYSIYILNRYVIGYFAFWFFYSLANKKVLAMFYYGLICFIALTTIASLGIQMFPHFGTSLPDMNMLLPHYGHNYLAHLIIFLIPITTQNIMQRQRWQDYAFFLISIVLIIMTFARGAWVIIAGYVIYEAIINRKLFSKKLLTLFFAIAMLLSTLFISLFHFQAPKTFSSNSINEVITQFIAKESPIQNRMEYWRQSVKAIQERPLAGSGPGTFFLQSQRLQRLPQIYSLFAHSFPLQTLVEFGIIGALGMFTLLYLLFHQIIHNLNFLDTGTKKYAAPLLEGGILTGLYSIYEFNLDFIIIWILFWAILGVSLGVKNKQTKITHHTPLLVYTALIGLLIFYGLSLSGLVLQFISKNTAALSVMPFHTQFAVDYIQKQQSYTMLLSDNQIQLLSFFHKNDHQILDAILKTNATTFSAAEKRNIYTRLITLYPKNEHYHAQYIDFLIRGQNYREAGVQIEAYSLEFLPPVYKDAIRQAGPLEANEVKEVASMTSDLINDDMNHEKRVSRISYIAGLASITTSPERTKNFWELSRQLDPGLSYYYIELASLTRNVLYDIEAANQILIECKKNVAAAEHCADVEKNGLPKVGSLKSAILTFP